MKCVALLLSIGVLVCVSADQLHAKRLKNSLAVLQYQHNGEALRDSAPSVLTVRESSVVKAPLVNGKEEHSTESITAAPDTPQWSMLSNLAQGIVITFGLIGVSILALRRWRGTLGVFGGDSSKSRILQSLSLGQRGDVFLVDLDGVRMVVGSDSIGVKVIMFPPDGFANKVHNADDGPTEGSLWRESEDLYHPAQHVAA